MDHFDDYQIEDSANFDFQEAFYDGLFDEEDDDRSFNSYLNANYDY